MCVLVVLFISFVPSLLFFYNQLVKAFWSEQLPFWDSNTKMLTQECSWKVIGGTPPLVEVRLLQKRAWEIPELQKETRKIPELRKGTRKIPGTLKKS